MRGWPHATELCGFRGLVLWPAVPPHSTPPFHGHPGHSPQSDLVWGQCLAWSDLVTCELCVLVPDIPSRPVGLELYLSSGGKHVLIGN